MPVKLRLRRQGRKGLAHYAIVAADSRSPRDGRYIEKIGTYDPISHPAKVYIEHEDALKWLKQGAQPTNTVRALLRHTGVTVKFALFRQGKSEEEAEKIFARWRAEKDAKNKKKVISVDIHGNPLEPVPNQPAEKRKVAPASEGKEEAPKAEEVVPVAEETPKAEEAPVEAPKAEEAPAEAPKAEEAPAEAPKAEEAPAEAPKAEEAPVETPKAEEAPVEAPKAEEALAEAPKVEESPAKEDKKPEAKKEKAAEEAPAEEPKSEEKADDAEDQKKEEDKDK